MKKIYKYRVISCVLGLLALGGGCKPKAPQDDSVLESRTALQSETSSDVAVLYFGGFHSCNYSNNESFPDRVDPIVVVPSTHVMTMTPWVARINHNAAKQPKTFIACYPFWTNFSQNVGDVIGAILGKVPTRGGAMASQPFENVIYFRHNLAGSITPTQKVKLADLMKDLGGMLIKNKITKVAIMGHSYGGNTAMIMANMLLRNYPSIKLTKLYTFDPISLDTCRPETISQAVQAKKSLPGCSFAPGIKIPDSTMNTGAIQFIAGKTQWTNVWQGADIFLHSSAINVPGVVNREVVYNSQQKNGVANHILFVYPDDRKNPSWPPLAQSIVKEVQDSLR